MDNSTTDNKERDRERDSRLPVLRVPQSLRLPDNTQWENRFNVRSESSNRLYVIAQNKGKRYWGCSCPGWKAHRRCKHLTAIGVPNQCAPYEVQLKESNDNG